MSKANEIGDAADVTDLEDHEPRRTLVAIAFLLGLAAWLLWVALHYRAMHYVPDFPKHGTKIISSPRSNAALGAFLCGELLALLASLVSLIALFMNRRTSMTVLLCLPGPALVAYPFLALFLNELWRSTHR